jgi:outer membrane protein assembly factor BamB
MMNGHRRVKGSRMIRLGGAAGIAALVLATLASPANAAISPTVPVPSIANGTAPTYQWPEFHNTSNLDGVSADPTITSTNAPALGVKWMTPIGSSLASPVVAYDSTLGETLAYVGTSAGYFDAVNAANGQIVWSSPLGTSATSSPLVDGNNVWIAPTGNGRAYKLDASTGAIECSASVSLSILSTPVLATPPGGSPTVYFASLGNGSVNGHVWGFSEADCSQIWSFNNFNTSGQDSGVWDELSYAVSASGEGLLLFGSANPDSSVYALDAVTGLEVWRFQTYQPAGEDWDVGAGITSTAPGVNGFTDGMAYTDGKDGIFYALDLTTGTLVWQYNFGGNGPGIVPPVNTDALTAPALNGTTLVFGATGSEWALNAVTGKLLWQYSIGGSDDVNSSAAIVGPQNGRVVVFGSRSGLIRVLGLFSGKLLYSYQTGGEITSSPADVDGNLIIASEDGFLYDIGLGGGNGSTPTTIVTSPTAGATVTNPDAPLTISGTASAPDGVGAVDVEVQTPAGTGAWVDGTTLTPGVAVNAATLASPGATSTTWSLSVPTTGSGGTYQVMAEAVGSNGVADTSAEVGTASPDNVTFNVGADASAPVVTLSANRAAPASPLTLTGSGFGVSETVTVTVPVSNTNTTTLLTTKTTVTGTINPSKIVVPAAIPFGPTTVTVTGSPSGDVGATQLYISNDSPQLGYSSTRTGVETHDAILTHHQATTRSNMLGLVWTFSAGGATDSTPAISQGVAYLGDSSGDIYAVTVTTGVPVWSTSVPAGVQSSPAVDGGHVIFGDDAGAVVSLESTTGASDWSTAVGSMVTTAPAVVGGVVYVTSNDGVLTAINESNGHIKWSKAVASGALTGVAVDPAAGLAFVGDSAGNVDAYSLSGTPKWSVPTGGPVVATPAVGAGNVYIGSTSGQFFALREPTGATVWTAASSGPITAAANLAASYVVVGSQGGSVSSYDLATGAVLGTEPIGSPVTSIVSTIGITVAGTSHGQLALNRQPTGAVEAWKYSGAAPSYPAPGVLINGEYLVAGSNGQLQAFAIPGNPLR